MARVLLVEPDDDLKQKEFERERINTPINLVYLATAIEDRHDVKIYDRNLHPGDEDYVKILKEYKPDIVGFTTMTTAMIYDVMHLGELTKKIEKKITIVVGGIHASVEPDSVLREPYVDYIIRGEADEAFLEFCDIFDKNPGKLKNLKNVNKNHMRSFVDMTKLKIPNYDLLELDKYDHTYIMLSRGCTGNCTFCCSTRTWSINGKPYVRSYTTKQIIEFFRKIIEEHGIKTFSIVDDNFVANKTQAIEVCKYLKDKGVHFFCFARADSMDDEIMKALKEAGCHTIQIGIESGSQRVLNFLAKRTTVEQNINAIRLCKKYGITCDASFMVGLPTETKEELDMTLNFVKKYKPDLPNAKIYLPMPGAPLFDFCISKGLLKKPTTLKDWVEWTGNQLTIEVKHKVNDIPEEYIVRTIQKIISINFHKNKLKRLQYWMTVGDYRYILKSAKRFFIWRGKLVLPFIGMRSRKY
jgi:anaerobic magnesium-protoporphyrin IX monomethyl ester cyclase